MFKQVQHIHFVGIGGIGMSGIAEVLLNLGYCVSGSDLKRSAVTQKLRKKGAKIFVGHTQKNVEGAHAVVVSSAILNGNPEVRAAQDANIPVVPRAEMLAELMRLKYGIAVAGTHGKTTTTSLVGAVLSEGKKDPTLIIGGRVNSLRGNARLGKGEYLVAEADESDQSFLKLNPTIAVVTNIDPEHMENYQNFQEVKESFVAFANKVPFYGCVVACIDHPVVRSVAPQIKRRLVTYALEGPADFTGKNIVQKETRISFDVLYKGKELGRVDLRGPGRHHAANALAAVAVGFALDIPFATIRRALKNFKGIHRRFEVLRTTNPMVVDDYAHHPVEIAATFDAVKEGWPGYHVVAVVQPHRYTRLHTLMDDFVKVLGNNADSLVLMPVYGAGEKPIPGVTVENLFAAIRKNHPKKMIAVCSSLEEIKTAIKSCMSEKIICLFLGAGDITKIARQFARSA